jgi:predicted PurR-regulated permease PerM
MVIIGLLTGIGLWLLGIPLVFTLAGIAGLLVFIPVIGPILSAVPAILVAFLVGPMHALYVGLLYLGIQQFESNLILPPIQRFMISLPPVLLILAMTVMYKLAGILGLFLAAPLTAAVIVIVRMVYVDDVLEADSPK